jgi:gluconokinase
MPAMTSIVAVVMGVSGSGKSTVAERLAAELGWDFLEGDRLHAPANLAKMGSGIPLDDHDRRPWLDSIEAWMADHLQAGRNGVVACSALRRVYRDRLRRAGPGVRFIYLRVPRAILWDRMTHRRHFMPPSLLDSQLATLEEPGADEDAVAVAADGTLEATLAQARRALGA